MKMFATLLRIFFLMKTANSMYSSIIVYKCVIPACRIDSDYVEVDYGKQADSVVLQQNAAYCTQAQLQQNVSYITSTENDEYVLLQSMYIGLY